MPQDKPVEGTDAAETPDEPQERSSAAAAPAAKAEPVAPVAKPEPVAPASPAVPAVPVGYGAADGYGTATVAAVSVDEDGEVDVEAVRTTLVGPSLLARAGAEAFGTFVVVLAVLGAALYAGVSSQTLAAPLAYGFGVIAAFVAVAHVSGGHFNPAITVGAAIAGRTPWRHVLPYWVAQLVGGALASAVMFVVYASFPLLDGQERTFFSTVANGFDTHSPLAQSTGSTDGGFGLVPALLIEAVLVAVIVGVYLGATDRRGTRQQAGVAVGLTVAFATLIAVPMTNAALNPARATAAAIFSESWAWEQLWLFWVAPLLGAAVAAVLYRAFAAAPEEDDLVDEEIEIEEIAVHPAR